MIWEIVATYLKLELTLVAIVLYVDLAQTGIDFPTARIVRLRSRR